MSVQNPERLATKQDLKDMYDRIRPYMGGLVTSKAGFTPIGTIISVMGTTAPVNYLACDGTIYNIADYTELANYFNEQFGSINFFGGDGTTTFAVPDLRGEFLRGTGTNSHTSNGDGASVGVHQDSTIFPHFITQNNRGFYRLTGTLNPDKTLAKTAGTYVFNASNVESAETINNCNTARPTNTSVLFCIATKNFYIDPTLDYSTDEKVVGTWINGKPIYQRTIPLSLPTQSGAQPLTSNVDVSDVSKYLKCEIIAISNDNHTYIMPTIHANSNEFQLSPFNYGKLSGSNIFYVYFSYLGTKFYNDNNYKIVEIYAVVQYLKS